MQTISVLILFPRIIPLARILVDALRAVLSKRNGYTKPRGKNDLSSFLSAIKLPVFAFVFLGGDHPNQIALKHLENNKK